MNDVVEEFLFYLLGSGGAVVGCCCLQRRHLVLREDVWTRLSIQVAIPTFTAWHTYTGMGLKKRRTSLDNLQYGEWPCGSNARPFEGQSKVNF